MLHMIVHMPSLSTMQDTVDIECTRPSRPTLQVLLPQGNQSRIQHQVNMQAAKNRTRRMNYTIHQSSSRGGGGERNMERIGGLFISLQFFPRLELRYTTPRTEVHALSVPHRIPQHAPHTKVYALHNIPQSCY